MAREGCVLRAAASKRTSSSVLLNDLSAPDAEQVASKHRPRPSPRQPRNRPQQTAGDKLKRVNGEAARRPWNKTNP